MKKRKVTLSYEIYQSVSELPSVYKELLDEATAALKKAYAPYSNFTVSAAARLANGKIVTGTNQENAAYSVTICAERVLLANAVMQYPGVAITEIAITYYNRKKNAANSKTISPCGMCRQALAEFEDRTGGAMTIVLGAANGETFVIDGANSLLPLGFNDSDLS